MKETDTSKAKKRFSIQLPDVSAGLTVAIAAIPDALANAVIATVNPVQGLYAAMIGPIVGAYWSGSFWMNINSTTALALVASDILSPISNPAQKHGVLILLCILTGLFQLLLGTVHLRKLTRFVSNSVMTGFITGIAVLVFLGQLNNFLGIDLKASNKVVQAYLTLNRIMDVDLATLGIGIVSIFTIIALKRTKIGRYSLLLAIVISALLTTLGKQFFPELMSNVKTLGEIPRAIPIPQLPAGSAWRLIDEIIPAALALAFTGLIQSAGISESFPNPDGKYPAGGKDLVAQGGGNIISGLFGGLPVGGSIASTALMSSSGAVSRMAHVFSGLSVLIAVLLFSSVIGLIPQAALAALLIVASVQSISPARIRSIWQAGGLATLGMVVTFAGTMILSLPIAVIIGVGISFLLVIGRNAEQARLMELKRGPEGFYHEGPVPKELKSDSTTILIPYGSLFFAAARYLFLQLPDVGKAQNAVVIIVLRGRKHLGSTFIQVIQRYAKALSKNNCRLILSGVGTEIEKQLNRTGTTRLLGPNGVIKATYYVGEALGKAVQESKKWTNDHSINI